LITHHNFHFGERIRRHEAVALTRKNVRASEAAKVLYLTNAVGQRAEALRHREIPRGKSFASL
jgi:hypothetical protein